MTPETLGRYEILGELGKGAMGVVYLAQDPLIQRQLAIKTFRMAYSAKEKEVQQFRERFLREAQAIGQLSHPNVVTVHDLGQEDDEYFIAMEYVKGENLKQKMQREEGPLPLDFVIDVTAQIAAGLAGAHAKGIVHRDVKPANIIITQDQHVKITDFGIARIEKSNLTVAGQLLGTPNYMAPEQIQGKPVDARTDIFSLGVLLYEMLTRKKPFAGENLTQVSHRIVYDDFTPPDEYVEDLPQELNEILHRALRKDPDERYQDAAEMARDLRALLEVAEAPSGEVATVDPVESSPAVAPPAVAPPAVASPAVAPPAVPPEVPDMAEVPDPAASEVGELAKAATPPAIPESAATSEPADILGSAEVPDSSEVPEPLSVEAVVLSEPAEAAAFDSFLPPLPQDSMSVEGSTQFPESGTDRPVSSPAVSERPVQPRPVPPPGERASTSRRTPALWIGLGLFVLTAIGVTSLALVLGGGETTGESPTALSLEDRLRNEAAVIERAEAMVAIGDPDGALDVLYAAMSKSPFHHRLVPLYLRISDQIPPEQDIVQEYIQERMTGASELIAKKDYEEAYTVLEQILFVEEHNEWTLQKAEDIRRHISKPRPIRRGKQGRRTLPPPTDPQPRAVIPPPPPPSPVDVAISFRTLVAEGSVTIYANGQIVLQESFNFDNRRGFKKRFLRGERGFDKSHAVLPGTIEVEVEVEVEVKNGRQKLKKRTLSGNIVAGTARTLTIVVREDLTLDIKLL